MFSNHGALKEGVDSFVGSQYDKKDNLAEELNDLIGEQCFADCYASAVIPDG